MKNVLLYRASVLATRVKRLLPIVTVTLVMIFFLGHDHEGTLTAKMYNKLNFFIGFMKVSFNNAVTHYAHDFKDEFSYDRQS